MNKYTLKFKDENLEALYQNFLLEKILHPVFMVLMSFSIVILIIKNIDGFINQNQSQMTLKLVGLALLSLLTIICYFFKKFTRIAFYISNHFMMIYQIGQRTDNSQHTYLFGQNQMFIHSIIMFVSDYPDGIITNITWSLTRLLIANLVEEGIDYQDQIYCIGVFFSLFLCLYIKNEHLRKAYLFSIKDNQWGNYLQIKKEIMLPNLISKPTFIFTFDQVKQQFQIQRMLWMQFLREQENPLQYFLRQARVGSKTLEQYIWERIMAKQKEIATMRYSMQQLNICYQKHNKQITLSECQLEAPTYILIVDSDDKGLIEQAQKHKLELQNKQNKIQQLLHIQQRIINKILKDRNFELTFDLSLTMIQLIQRYNLQGSKLQLINLTNMIDNIIRYFQTFQKSEYDFQCKQTILILTIQPLMISYLIYLFQNIRQYNNIIVELQKNDRQIQLQILGQMSTKITPFYSQVEQILIKKKILIKPCTILIFNESPLLSYTSQVVNY